MQHPEHFMSLLQLSNCMTSRVLLWGDATRHSFEKEQRRHPLPKAALQ